MGQDAEPGHALDPSLVETYCAVLTRFGAKRFRCDLFEIEFSSDEPAVEPAGFTAPQRHDLPQDDEDFSQPKRNGYDAIFGGRKPSFKKPKPTGAVGDE